MKTLKYICLISLLFTICSCSSCKKEKGKPAKPTPLNVTVLIDLSKRIKETTNNVEQQKKDIELIIHILDKMIKKAQTSNLNLDDKLQVLYSPEPKLENLSEISSNLRLDMHCTTQKDRVKLKQKLRIADSLFSVNLNLLYDKTIETNKWEGSDIWTWFENKVQDYCIKDGCRNVLVILTDGYIEHIYNKKQKENKYSFIKPGLLSDKPNARLLNPLEENEKLDDLEVLILEINPNPPTQEKLLCTVLEEWLKEMGVKEYKLLGTDFPSNVKPLIDEFIFNK